MSVIRNCVILAPHVDDEVIGCYRLLMSGRVAAVYYRFDLTLKRMAEAQACGERFGFQPRMLEEDEIPSTVELYVPSGHDWHPHHKYVNQLAITLPNYVTHYSVDMNVRVDALDYDVRIAKRDALLELFPSQHALLAYNEKFWLFEAKL